VSFGRTAALVPTRPGVAEERNRCVELTWRRANNVLKGLVSRGIPIERFQVVAKGETDPALN
jgi:outer membrane protein OmpA-like peptidoglycan-associated protein